MPRSPQTRRNNRDSATLSFNQRNVKTTLPWYPLESVSILIEREWRTAKDPLRLKFLNVVIDKVSLSNLLTGKKQVDRTGPIEYVNWDQLGYAA